jgi:hypothetical protein
MKGNDVIELLKEAGDQLANNFDRFACAMCSHDKSPDDCPCGMKATGKVIDHIEALLAATPEATWKEGSGGDVYGKDGKVQLKQWTMVTDDLGILVREIVPGMFAYELRPRAYATPEEAKAAALYAAERWVSPGAAPYPNSAPLFIGPTGDKR